PACTCLAIATAVPRCTAPAVLPPLAIATTPLLFSVQSPCPGHPLGRSVVNVPLFIPRYGVLRADPRNRRRRLHRLPPCRSAAGAGFMGSHLVDALLASGHQVRVLDNLTTGSQENLAHHAGSPNLHFVEGAVTDAAAVAQAIDGCAIVYHLAAAIGVRYVIDD